MRQQKQRAIHYSAISLYDGTVMTACPVRKPIPKTIKRKKFRIDEDGVGDESTSAGKELSDVQNEIRTRFLDIIATRLNTRRAIREIVCPLLIKLQQDMDEVRNQLVHIKRLLKSQENVMP